MTALAPAPTTLDAPSRPVPFQRLVGVELRKTADTRAGFWLLVVIAVTTAVIVAGGVIGLDEKDRTFLAFVGLTSIAQGILLPVLGIMLVTSEWGQRTALVTFTLTPRRGKVVAAKVVAALLLGAAALALVVALASVATAAAGPDDAWAGIAADDLAKLALLQVSGVLQGLAFGLLFLNTATAIVTFFALPMGFMILSALWSAMTDVAPWVDLGTSQPWLYSNLDLTGEQWVQVATGSTIWIALPFVLGLFRVMRAEVK